MPGDKSASKWHTMKAMAWRVILDSCFNADVVALFSGWVFYRTFKLKLGQSEPRAIIVWFWTITPHILCVCVCVCLHPQGLPLLRCLWSHGLERSLVLTVPWSSDGFSTTLSEYTESRFDIVTDSCQITLKGWGWRYSQFFPIDNKS